MVAHLVCCFQLEQDFQTVLAAQSALLPKLSTVVVYDNALGKQNVGLHNMLMSQPANPYRQNYHVW